MPDDGGHKVHNINEPLGDHASGRHDRPALAIFISDARSEEALRDGLTDFVTEDPDIRRGGVRAAIAAMQKSRDAEGAGGRCQRRGSAAHRTG